MLRHMDSQLHNNNQATNRTRLDILYKILINIFFWCTLILAISIGWSLGAKGETLVNPQQRGVNWKQIKYETPLIDKYGNIPLPTKVGTVVKLSQVNQKGLRIILNSGITLSSTCVDIPIQQICISIEILPNGNDEAIYITRVAKPCSDTNRYYCTSLLLVP